MKHCYLGKIFVINLLILFILSYSLVSAQNVSSKPKEFKGVWIATVSNIDWPDVPTTDSNELKTSFNRLLDLHQKNGLNAVIVQIRPAADAFYASLYEPWSQWLTGTQGVAPQNNFDPLPFMIEAAHKRNLEFHAWLNPYRATFSPATVVCANHITRKKPNWFISYGGKKYFDPGNKEVQQYFLNIVKDIVTRYNIDGIHIDDYFYPYPVTGLTFNDRSTYATFNNGLSVADWRRSNTDSIIKNMFSTIKSIKPNCRFGVSPFGIWRHKANDAEGSNTKAGLTNYDDLYADILLWLKHGWVDYVAPQLYWETTHPIAPFTTLVDWWAKHTYGKDCYIGIAYYRVGSNAAWKNLEEIPNQIKLIRSYPTLKGFSFYSSKTFEKNPYNLNAVITK